jgi:hypothetical protein
MDAYGTAMFVAGFAAAFDVAMRNTVTGERMTMTVYANDATAAYAKVFRMMDAQSGDRSWCVDGFTRRDA